MRRRPYLVGAIVVVGAAVAVAVPASRSEASGNQTIQHQGRLVDSNGVPLEATVTLRFRIFASATPSAADFLWGERHDNVIVRRGVYTVHLGAGQATLDAAGGETAAPRPFTDEFDAGDPRFIEVQVNADPPLAPLSQIGAVPFAIAAAGTVPIGTVLSWWPTAPGAGVPAGYEYCDGTPVVTDGPLKGFNKPDLMGTQRFLRGISMSNLGSFGGGNAFTTGGTDTTPHHQHSVPGLASHTHKVRGRTERNTQLANPGAGVDDFRAIVVLNNHSHEIDLETESATGASSSTGLGGTHDNRPAYVEIAFIVRVR